ncbi:MAG: hypothetical protein JHD16_13085, partial [Solirubrobacteraceae bacterium]|nr:hypothetical protein [Solirubrobacteraceae bacterium]
ACAALTFTLAAGGLSGCGDDAPASGSRAKDAPAIGEAKKPTIQASLLGDSQSAGAAESYEPTGELIADSGFRPEVNGFSFENYGNDVQPANLSTANIQALFGDQVCVGGDGDNCKLIPPAKRWMEQENARMAGGHCMGMSVAAIRMFLDTLPESEFGGDDATAELEIVGNEALQRSIAEHWVYQDLPKIQQAKFQGTPTEIVNELVETLNNGKEDYTIGLYMPDYSGGHAITPFAIEDRGDGQVSILVYDNNFPGVTRALDVDTNDDTWSYVGGINPSNADEVYEGNADTGTLELLPTSPGEQVQPCAFCRSDAVEEDAEGLGSTLSAEDQYAELTLRTKGRGEHPHLVISDEEGRQTGIVDGKMLREIPGVQIAGSLGVKNWDTAPEPRYQLPLGTPYNVTIDGSSVNRTSISTLDLTGGGLVVSAETVRITPGQQDSLTITGDSNGFLYESNSKNEEVPEFFAGLEDGDEAYTLLATAVGVKPGSEFGLFIDRESGTVLVDADGVKGSVDGKAFFGVAVNRYSADADDTWMRQTTLSGRKKEGLYFNYKDAPEAGKPLPLEIGPEDGPFRIVRASYQR